MYVCNNLAALADHCSRPVKVAGIDYRLTYDHFVHILASKYGEAALMKVHDGQMRPPPLCNILICVQSYQQEVPLLLGFLSNRRH